MSALSLSRYLPDFSTHRIADEAVEIIPAPAAPRPLKTAPEKPEADMPDILAPDAIADAIALEEEKRAAHEAGRAEGRAEAEALYEAEKARLQREHLAETEASRAAFSREQAILLATALTEGLSALEQRLSAQLSEIMMPLLAAKMEAEAVAEFMRRFIALALDGETPEISGPAHLLAPLRANRDALPQGCRFQETAASELSFSFGERALETRIAPLLEELKAAIA